MNGKPRNAHLFVHREKELKAVQEQLSLLRAGKTIFEPVVFFGGVPLIGKSALLQAIRNHAIQHQIPVANIDISSGYGDVSGRVSLVRETAKQWELTTEAEFLTATFFDNNPNNAAIQLKLCVKRCQQGCPATPLVLLLDTMEIMKLETFSWLQNNLLEPMLDEGKVFIGIASRTELRFELSWRVARRARFVKLQPFTSEETRDHYTALLNNASPTSWQKRLIDNPNCITFGIPGLNEVAFRHPFETEEEAVRYMVEDHFSECIIQGDIDEIKDLILVMSSFRKFDYRILARISNYYWPDKYPDVSRRTGVQLARTIQATMLLEMKQDGYGYVICPDIRPLLDTYERFRNKQQHFETHCLAYNWFRDEVVRGDFVSVADQVYHLAGAWFDMQCDKYGELSIPDNLPKEKDNRIEIIAGIVSSGLRNLADKSRADTQVEKVLNAFQQEKGELSRFLSEDEITTLIETCRKVFGQAVQIADQDEGK